MAEWVRCTVKDPFLEGDVVHWEEPIRERHPKKRDLVKIGEREVTAVLMKELRDGWLELEVISSTVIVDYTESRRANPEPKNKKIKRHRGTLFKNRARRSRKTWDNEARETVAETIKRDGGLAMSYNRRSRQEAAGQ